MHVPSSRSSGSSRPRSSALLPLVTAAALAGACGGGGGGSTQSGTVGEELTNPATGGSFFVDPNGSGSRSSVHLAEVLWGRLVDVHEVDAGGARIDPPLHDDFVVEPNVLTGGGYILDRNPVTQRERLTIQARKTGVTDSSAFDSLFEAAYDALPVVDEKGSTSSPPFSSVPRNACVVLRFDDCLDDDAAASLQLQSTVRVVTGYPPSVPYDARLLFDPNHGALISNAFHSTRVLVDLAVSEADKLSSPFPLDVNQVGVPESVPETASAAANVAVRVPTRADVGSGQPNVLTNLSGIALDEEGNGPIVVGSPTVDVERAMRSGNSEDDQSNGFLPDAERPRVVGGWPVTVSNAADDPAGPTDLAFLVDLEFTTSCLNAPASGDAILVNGVLLQVTEAGALVGSSVTGLEVRSLIAIPNAPQLNGSGLFEAPFHPSLTVDTGCWVSFLPEPDAVSFPDTNVSTTASVLLRFSEPMDPSTLSPFGDFLVVAGDTADAPISHNIVVGEVTPSGDLTVFTFAPDLPLRHALNEATDFHVALQSPLDLAGNPLRNPLPPVGFQIAPLDPEQKNGAIVLRFESPDEYAPNGGAPDLDPDLRGQFFYNGEKGSIFPRGVTFSGWTADRTHPVPAAMLAVAGGTLHPLNPLGAKLQMLWRYCDFGWTVRDETKYNLDVVGLAWSPAAGGVQADFYELFEIRLGHSRFLPDEHINTTSGLVDYPGSGLPAATAFEGNYVVGSNPKVVHDRTLGYAVNPSNRFNATTGVLMMPYPLNRGASPDQTYTWRDTALVRKGVDGSGGQPGVPLDIEIDVGVGGGGAGSFASKPNVPSVGFPLLIEFSCFPSDSGLGNNNLDVSIAPPPTTPASPPPNFRVYSAGGVNSVSNQQLVLPDSALIPSGGFNPLSAPPGQVTPPGDNIFYIGQLDTVIRVSRVHTVWLDSGLPPTTWLPAVIEPAGVNQPAGTSVVIEFRSATGFSGASAEAPFDATRLDAYGDQTVNAPLTLSDWSSDITTFNGRRYVQARLTFVNNTVTGTSAEVTGLAVPFLK